MIPILTAKDVKIVRPFFVKRLLKESPNEVMGDIDGFFESVINRDPNLRRIPEYDAVGEFEGIQAVTFDSIEYNCVDYLSTGGYYDACFEFISISEEAIHDYNSFPLFSRLGISLIIGCLSARALNVSSSVG